MNLLKSILSILLLVIYYFRLMWLSFEYDVRLNKKVNYNFPLKCSTDLLKKNHLKINTRPHSAVGNVSDYRRGSDCRPMGHEFDLSLVPYMAMTIALDLNVKQQNKQTQLKNQCIHRPINSYHSFWWSNLILCLHNVISLNISMKEFGDKNG